MKFTSKVTILVHLAKKLYANSFLFFYSFPLGLATRIPEATPGFCRNEIPAVRQRNQVHHLPGESENFLYEQQVIHSSTIFQTSVCLKTSFLSVVLKTLVPHGE